MRNKKNKHLGIEIDPELHYKLHYINFQMYLMLLMYFYFFHYQLLIILLLKHLHYYFECYFEDNEKETVKLNIDGRMINNLVFNQNYSDDAITLSQGDVQQLTIVPFSKDNLIEDWKINILKHNNKIYVADGYTNNTVDAFELAKEEADYFNKLFEN